MSETDPEDPFAPPRRIYCCEPLSSRASQYGGPLCRRQAQAVVQHGERFALTCFDHAWKLAAAYGADCLVHFVTLDYPEPKLTYSPDSLDDDARYEVWWRFGHWDWRHRRQVSTRSRDAVFGLAEPLTE